MSTENMNEALDWSSSIEKESEFELLPEGEYEFRVESMERGRYPGSERMSACPMANITLILTDDAGEQHKVFDTLYLHKKSEWKLSQFFVGIGQKKKGEPLNPRWDEVPGSTGRLELTINEYTSKTDGTKKKNNKVSRYLPKEVKKWAPGGGF